VPLKDIDDREMPLLEHLLELRTRLMYSALAIFVAFVVAYFFSDDIFWILARPLARAQAAAGETDPKMVYTALTEFFFTRVRIAFWAGFFIAFPVVASQLWMFIAPGLYRNEKEAFLPFLAATPILFFIGGAFAYFVVFPVAWSFFLSFQTPNGGGGVPIEFLPKVGEYLDIVMKLLLAFGIAFEMPVALTLLGRVGILTSDMLVQGRRYAIVLMFIVAAVLTPPDVFSQCSLALPMILLYEISIFLVRRAERAKARRDAEEEAQNADSATTRELDRVD
jgi:sec-independent protein translocase protein TatC